MHIDKIPVRYAKALLLAAKEGGRLDIVHNEMVSLAELLGNNPELVYLLKDPALKGESKKKILNDLMGKNITVETDNLLNLVIIKRRESHLPQIISVFKYLYKKDKGIREVTLKTPFKPDKEMFAFFSEMIGKKLKSEIEITNVVDDSLIGGFTLKVDDLLYDASIKTQLGKLKEKLIQRI